MIIRKPDACNLFILHLFTHGFQMFFFVRTVAKVEIITSKSQVLHHALKGKRKKETEDYMQGKG